MKELKQQIKIKQFDTIYLFYGPEEYLINYYTEQMKNALLPKEMEFMNLDLLEGKQITATQLMDAVETLPFMIDRKLVIVKQSELFQSGRKDETEKITSYIKSIPNTACVLFIEKDIDKRSKLYKAIVKYGKVIEFSYPSDSELIHWIQKSFEKYQMKICPKTAAYMLQIVGNSMTTLSGEIQKLVSYKSGASQVDVQDINTVCSKTLEAKIFDLMNAIGTQDAGKALGEYENLLTLKESPMMVLAMITRQFKIIFQTKHLYSMGYDPTRIAEKLGQRPFVIRECIKQAGNFSEHALSTAIKECLDTDMCIKKGLMDSALGVEILIVKYSTNKKTTF